MSNSVKNGIQRFNMQNSRNTSLRIHIKYTFILLLWTLLLMFVFNIYSQGSSYVEFIPKFRRESKNKDFIEARKVLGNFLDIKKFPEFNASEDLSYDELIAAVEEELPSLPFRYWFWNSNNILQMSPNCAQFPDLMRLNYYNKYWQTFQLENITFQLYSAYYDNRPTVDTRQTVRLLAMLNTIQPDLPAFYCQLWYDEQSKPVLTTALLSMIWYYSWGHAIEDFYPYLVTCFLPEDLNHLVPKVVSLVSTECERAENSLRVYYEQPQAPNVKQQFAVCVKGLDFPNRDISARLVEWIEMQQIMGASKIYFYLLEVHPNVTKVLQHYVKRGIVDVKPITLADGLPHMPQLQHLFLRFDIQSKRHNEIIPYNDCFYRNIQNYDYIALEDIDEVIMPLGNRTTWAELVEFAAKIRPDNCKNGYASYCFGNVHFPDFSNESGLLYYPEGVPNYMHMLNHVLRSNKLLPVGHATKCLHNTGHVVSVHNHYPIEYKNACFTFDFPTEIAQLNHYRHEDKERDFTESVKDMSLWRFKGVLLERSMKAFEEMDFVKDDS